MSEEKNYPSQDRVYRHYKGGLYEVISLAQNSSPQKTHGVATDQEQIMVVYKSKELGTIYTRPLSEWNEKVIIEDELETLFAGKTVMKTVPRFQVI